MSVVSYDLSIISELEAADRLGVMAAEMEELLEDHDPGYPAWSIQQHTDPSSSAVEAANRATIALDILALRKAQVAMMTLFNRSLDTSIERMNERLRERAEQP